MFPAPDAPPSAPVAAPRWSLAARIGRASLLVKVLTNSLAITLLVSVTLTWLASWQFAQRLREDAVEAAEVLAGAVVRRVEAGIEDGKPMQALVDSGMALSRSEYLWVEGADGRVRGHSFGAAFPEGLAAQVAEGEGPVREGIRLETPEGAREVMDVAVHVEGAGGTVHVGINADRIQEAVGHLRWVMLLGGLCAALAAVALGQGFMRLWVVHPLRKLTGATARIVETGDLTLRLGDYAQDEVGQLAATFQQMVDRQRDVLLSLQEASSAVIQMTTALQLSAEEQRDMVTRQAASLQQTQVTVQEIQQTSLMAAQKAEVVLEVAAKAEGLGSDGEGAVDRTLEALTVVRTQVEALAERMRQLGERTRQIGGITQTVKDLADQSNMLALNAAIEAVRSGEHGKGFGVVAREIRSLADQSIQSTQRVREILDDISTAIAAAVDVTAQGAQGMEAGLVQVRATGGSIRALGDIVRANLAAAQQIAAAVSQQNAGVQQIFSALTDQTTLMEETVTRINASGEAAQALQELSERLAQTARTYRTTA